MVPALAGGTDLEGAKRGLVLFWALKCRRAMADNGIDKDDLYWGA
jgi:hypothetical protein